MSDADTFDDLLDPKPNPERERQRFTAALAELKFIPADLAAFMDKNRDYRDFSATIRSIQRMLSGETRVSGEMMVIVNMLLRQHRRLKAKYPNLQWQRNEHGVHSAQVEGWFVYVSPQTRGRWRLECSSGPSRSDYSPSWGRWLDSLEEAKEKALVCVEEGMNDLAELTYQEF
ncbi:hypothetical protein MesoLj131b_06950 [Mesorhizobium sp. 131-2-5]|uniref:hypothetical protein n=1 Tax=Mesorhizobium sp. 131-2-5 TaxID=2744519 RepID=UPI00192659B5|nr:hypothetical protein [Mesorhizobium sp. 131-2-5]BCG98695.1 hypothetical protein MesoLj131b_06950 [Mesorhizobium sp. 131-2-5]